MSERTQKPKSFPLWTALWVALSFAGLYIVVDAYQSYQRTRQEQVRLLRHFTLDVDQRLTQRLVYANDALQNIGANLKQFLPNKTSPSRSANANLRFIAGSLTGVKEINIVSGDGEVLATSSREFVGRNLKNTRRFQTIQSGTNPYVTYVVPVFETSSGLITTAIARQTLNQQGRFNGYAMAILDPLYFKELLNSSLYNVDVEASLLDFEGRFLLTTDLKNGSDHKSIDEASEAFAGYFKNGNFQRPFEGQAFKAQDERLVVAHRISLDELDATEPIFLTISRSETAILADWYREVAIKVIIYVAFAALAIFSILIFKKYQRKLQKRVDQQQAAKRRAFKLLKESEGRFRSLFEETQQAILMIENGRFVDANRATLAMLRMTHLDQLLSSKPADLSPEFQPDGRLSAEAANAHIEYAIAHGSDAFEWEHVRANGDRFIAKVLLTAINRGGKQILQVVWNDITQEKKALAHISYLAFNDPNTGLANRLRGMALLQDAISNAKAQQSMLALMQVDLRSLRHVNDTYGHHIGDELIKEVSIRLKSAYPESDKTLARLGGDQFMIVLPADMGGTDAASSAHQLLALLTMPYFIEGIEIFQTFNIGLSLYPRDADDSEHLIRAVDTAVNNAKKHGPNAIQFFEPKMAAATTRYIEIRNALIRAIENQEFELHYQPQINLQTGDVIGAEALIRWHRPGHGLVMPGQFIDVAEESGLIEPIGRWVLQTACKQAKAWVDAGFNGFVVAVNLSAVQLRHGQLQVDVRQALSDAQLAAQHLELELTESILIDNANTSLALIDEWRETGIRLSIDDFGTGYSSLAYLKTLKVHKLKIDRSFVVGILKDPADLAIVKSIIDLCQGLDLVTIAEGIDDPDIAVALKNLGCNEAQGFYYAKGLPADEFMTWVAQSKNL